MIDNNSIFIVIPCYNESAVIRQTVNSILEKGYKVVVVDDCSKDNSKKQLEGLAVYYLRHRVNLGQGAALQTGIKFSLKKNAECIVTFDADGQHDVNDIGPMLESMGNKRSDIVFGSRFLPGAKTNITASRSFVLNAARYVNYLVSGILLSDAHNGLRVFTKRAAGLLNLTENKMAHATQIQIQVAQKKLTFTEMPNNIYYNKYTISKGSKNKDGIKILFEILLYKIFN